MTVSRRLRVISTINFLLKEKNMLKTFVACSLTVLVSVGVLLAHGDATHIMGTITALDGDHVTVKTQEGKSEMVMLGKATKYLIGTKAAKATDLKIGSRVVIDAKMDTNMKMYSALEVKIGVAAPAKTDTKAKAAPSTEKHSDHK
jgi:hypothetical protein